MLKWVKHDLENRSEFLAELLNLIRLNLLTVEHLIEKIECEPLVMANAECNRILHNVSFTGCLVKVYCYLHIIIVYYLIRCW